MSRENFYQTREAMADLVPGIPQELIIDILLRLPVKSAGKFRCVSKPWHSLLTDPQFIKSHLALHHHHPQKFIFISYKITAYEALLTNLSTITFSTRNHGHLRKLNLLENQLTYPKIVGSCNGLVLIVDDDFRRDWFSGTERVSPPDTMYLINPTTMELVKLPNGPWSWKALTNGEGFGYDSSNDDYKVVSLSQYTPVFAKPRSSDTYFDLAEPDSFDDYSDAAEPRHFDTYIDVFSLRSGTWKRVDNLPFHHLETHSGVLLNGALHWFESLDDLLVVAFDLSSEKFKPVPMPNTTIAPRAERTTCEWHKLLVLGGCLTIVVKRYTCQMDIWMMKEYGVAESWTKFSVSISEDMPFYEPICLLGDDEVVLVECGEKFVVHNLREGTTRDMMVAGIRCRFIDVMGFIESLVSPVLLKSEWRAT